MQKLTIFLIMMILTFLLFNLPSRCLAYNRSIPDGSIYLSSSRLNFCKIVGVYQFKYELGKDVMARDDEPEPPPQK